MCNTHRQMDSAVPSYVHDYLAKTVGTATWHKTQGRIELQSQVWRGVPWHHTIVLLEPLVRRSDVIVLEVTGGNPLPIDEERCQTLANETGCRVAILFNIPNQPLWDMVEDDLIAHTFSEFLATGEPDWPLLFPMTRAAIAAMDAIDPDARYVVTGSSKRGWTTWFVGVSGDERVIGIAPRVFDNLNVGQQMQHQIELWGDYSPRIDDYTRRGLQEMLDHPDGQELARNVDPYHYLSSLRVPVYCILGANDGYWAIDAARIYWDAIPCAKYSYVFPNELHGIGDACVDRPGLAGFVAACAGVIPWPRNEQFQDGVVWTAASTSPWFADSLWHADSAVSGEFVATFTNYRVTNEDGPDFLASSLPEIIMRR